MLDINSLKIQTIIENSSTKPSLLGQFGISFYIETKNNKFIFDTGAHSSITHNLDELKLNLNNIDAVLISHGHNDHTGGIKSIVKKIKSKPIKIIGHPNILGLKYGKSNNNENYKYIGMPYKKEEIESLGANFKLTEKPCWLSKDIALSGEIKMKTDFEYVEKNNFIKHNDIFIPDEVKDDQSLYIRTNKGLVVLSGCAHRGIINTIFHGCKLMNQNKIYMVLGGTHLSNASNNQIDLTIKNFKEMEIEYIGVSHCTGLKVAARMAFEFGSKFFFNNAGTCINFPFNIS